MANQQSTTTMSELNTGNEFDNYVQENAQVLGDSFGDLVYPGSERGSERSEDHFTQETKDGFAMQAESGNDIVAETASQRLEQVYHPDIFSSQDEGAQQKLQQLLATTPDGAHPFYHVIGTLGGNAVAKKYGQEFYKHIGALGGKAVREKYSAENLARMGLMSEQRAYELTAAHKSGIDHQGTVRSISGEISHGPSSQDGQRGGKEKGQRLVH